MKCRICGNEAPFFEKATMLQKHTVSFFKCGYCGFMQTEEPYWLQEAYTEAITRSDVGILYRNIQVAKTTRAIIKLFFNADGKFIDYAGGYGLFVRLMRDYGYNFFWHDKYCKNMFTQGLEADTSLPHTFELLTAFEVMEHLPDPVGELESMLELSDSILFTTTLLPKRVPPLGSWWYYGLDHGQHVSFYTLRSLSILADRFKLKLYSDGVSLHVLTAKRLSSFVIKLTSFKNKAPYALQNMFGRKSLIPLDYKAITGKDL